MSSKLLLEHLERYIEDVSALLGHGCVDFTLPYLEPSKESLRKAFEVAL